jgi:hypothetical protein
MCPRCTQLERAEFEEFVWRDHTGRVQFANDMRPPDGKERRFRDRVWPVFACVRRRVDRRRPSDVMRTPCGQKVNRSIIKSSDVCAARRWLPCSPLFAHAMRVGRERLAMIDPV